mmetsp:Transcript_30052/g.5432  ORF Transcript_30052/g.5432 Transcript_30052/m.5432 type:complete len:109 (+) Transcript_30052:638-964(+)
MDLTECSTNSISSDDVIDRYFSSSERKYLDLLTWVEEEFSCAGLCTPIPYYLFSDINEGEPDGSCYTELKDWIDENFLTYGAVCIVAAIILLLEPIFACCLCCKSDKK